jgi:hypothetical protein
LGGNCDDAFLSETISLLAVAANANANTIHSVRYTFIYPYLFSLANIRPSPMAIVDGENNTFASIDIYAILAFIEFGIHFCLLPISLLNVSVIGTSSLVHPSLKCLLLAQSALIAMGSGQQ